MPERGRAVRRSLLLPGPSSEQDAAAPCSICDAAMVRHMVPAHERAAAAADRDARAMATCLHAHALHQLLSEMPPHAGGAASAGAGGTLATLTLHGGSAGRMSFAPAALSAFAIRLRPWGLTVSMNSRQARVAELARQLKLPVLTANYDITGQPPTSARLLEASSPCWSSSWNSTGNCTHHPASPPSRNPEQATAMQASFPASERHGRSDGIPAAGNGCLRMPPVSYGAHDPIRWYVLIGPPAPL